MSRIGSSADYHEEVDSFDWWSNITEGLAEDKKAEAKLREIEKLRQEYDEMKVVKAQRIIRRKFHFVRKREGTVYSLPSFGKKFPGIFRHV
jgi:hypothetical protein